MLPDIETIENAARISMGDYDPPAESNGGPLRRLLGPGYSRGHWIVGLLLAVAAPRDRMTMQLSFPEPLPEADMKR